MRLSRLGSPAFLLFVVVLAFYLYTLAPSLTWGDGVKLQTEVALGGSVYMFFEEFTGAGQAAFDGLPFSRLGVAAWDHPLYVMLGQIFLKLPWGDVAYRANLMSALAAAAAIALMVYVGLFLTRDRRAALLGALALAVSHTFWWHAVTAEVYALHTLFLISLIGLALRWGRDRRWRELGLFAFLAGLGLANHVMLGLALLPCAAYMIAAATSDEAERSRAVISLRFYRTLFRAAISRRGALTAALFLAGLAPWWIQFIRMTRLVGVPLTLEMAAGSPWLPRSLLVPSVETLIVNFLIYAVWLSYQFTPIGAALGLWGLARLRRARPREARFLVALFIIHVAFSANYSVAERFAFHLPSYPIFGLFIVEGTAALLHSLDARLPRAGQRQRIAAYSALLATMVAAPVALYTITPRALYAMGFTDRQLGILPIGSGTRQALQVFLDPNRRGDDSAAQFGRSTLERLAPNALVFAPNNVDGEAYLVLRYFQLVERLRPDVRLELMLFRPPDLIPADLLAMARSQVACRPVYLMSLNPVAYPLAQLQADFAIEPEANLYRLLPRRAPRAAHTCPALDRRWAGVPLDQLIKEAIRWR